MTCDIYLLRSISGLSGCALSICDCFTLGSSFSMRTHARLGESLSVLDFVSLDCEGAELAILRTFPWEAHAVRTCAVEHNWHEPRRSEMRRLLEAHGMVLDHAMEHDDLYVARELLEPKGE